jgi:hypothetical protein
MQQVQQTGQHWKGHKNLHQQQNTKKSESQAFSK